MWVFLLVLVLVWFGLFVFFFILALISHFPLYIIYSSPLCLSACHQIIISRCLHYVVTVLLLQFFIFISHVINRSARI